MAYLTGSAADMAAVQTALVNACTSNGWSAGTDGAGKTVIYQDDASLANGIFVRLQTDTDDQGSEALNLLGRTGLDTGDAPSEVDMKSIKYVNISFPVTYHAFVFLTEVYFVINYDGDKYQWCAFGQSRQPGLPGTGNWVAASCGGYHSSESRSDNPPDQGLHMVSNGDSSSSYSDETTSAALFWNHVEAYNIDLQNCWLHNAIEPGYPWALRLSDNFGPIPGIKYLTELLDAQPNQFSGEGILMPVRAYKQRPESKVSQVAELEYVRHIRIDNYAPEQVITLGTDEWMVFPWYRKDITNRNGGIEIDHSGTFGWAIKKA